MKEKLFDFICYFALLFGLRAWLGFEVAVLVGLIFLLTMLVDRQNGRQKP